MRWITALCVVMLTVPALPSALAAEPETGESESPPDCWQFWWLCFESCPPGYTGYGRIYVYWIGVPGACTRLNAMDAA